MPTQSPAGWHYCVHGRQHRFGARADELPLPASGAGRHVDRHSAQVSRLGIAVASSTMWSDDTVWPCPPTLSSDDNTAVTPATNALSEPKLHAPCHIHTPLQVAAVRYPHPQRHTAISAPLPIAEPQSLSPHRHTAISVLSPQAHPGERLPPPRPPRASTPEPRSVGGFPPPPQDIPRPSRVGHQGVGGGVP